MPGEMQFVTPPRCCILEAALRNFDIKVSDLDFRLELPSNETVRVTAPLRFRIWSWHSR
jgi:hypothetical protein